MQITVSLDTLKVSNAAFALKRLDYLPLEVVFQSGGATIELPGGASGKLAIKAAASDSTFLAFSNGWTQAGVGEYASYVFDLNLNTAEMAAAFQSASTVSAVMEIEWQYGGYKYYTQTMAVTIADTVIDGTEGTPQAIPDLKASQAEAVAGTNDAKWMTPLKVAQSIVSRLGNAVLHDANDVISVKGIKSSTPVTIDVDDATTAHQWVFSSDGHVDVQKDGNQVGYFGTGFYADGQEIYLEKLDPSTGNVVAGNTVWFDTAHGNLTFAFPSSSGTIALTSDVSAAQSAAEAASVPLASKGVAGGVAGLDGVGKVPASQLPSYVDDVLEFSALSAFPTTGETGKIYVTTGTNKTYRWSGSTYVEIASSPGSTDAVTEGSTNLYFTAARAIAAVGGTLASYATQTALGGKANTVHTHTIADVTGLQTALDAKLPLAGGTLTGNLTAPNVAVTGQVQFYSGGSMVAHQFYNSATNSIDTVFP